MNQPSAPSAGVRVFVIGLLGSGRVGGGHVRGSLAATVHSLLAGRTPFEIPGRPNGSLDLIGRIERGAITPIGRDDVPRSLASVLAKGMATRREDRYPSAVEFARAGFSVLGYDVSERVVKLINDGHSHIKDVAAADVTARDYRAPPGEPRSILLRDAGPALT